jgi:hypothetical protein
MLVTNILCPQFSGVHRFARLPPVSVPTAVPCATNKSQITKMKLLFTWLVSFMFLLPHSAVLFTQHVGHILKVTFECNTSNNKRSDMNTFLKKLPTNTQHGNYCITCTTNMVQAKYYYMIHLQLTRQFYEHCNTSVMNKSYLLCRIPWKCEGCIFTICVTVLTPSGIAYLPRHSNGNILK